MFEIGELVIYGGEGVCRVERIGTAQIAGADKGRMYYTLVPLYRSGQVLTPVDTGVLIRPVMSREEAEELIAALPELAPEEIPGGGTRAAKEHYHTVVMSYDCRRLAGLIKALCRRRAAALRRGRKVSQMDERYLRRAEDAFYGELAAVLSLEREAVADRIREVCPAWQEG